LSDREFSEADTDLLNELWAGALFDIIQKVSTERPDWNESEQNALVYMVIEVLAERYGIIESDEDDEP
jgi:hypothetical protein